jgi:hypothetical protein
MAMIEYKRPLVGIFELTLMISGKVSTTLYIPVSRFVVNLIDSSCVIGAGGMPLSTLLHA